MALTVDPYNGRLTDKESVGLLKLIRVHRRLVKNQRDSDAFVLEQAINVMYSTLMEFPDTVITEWDEP